MLLARIRDEVRLQEQKVLARLRSLSRELDRVERTEEALSFSRKALELSSRSEIDFLRTAVLWGKLGRPEQGVNCLLDYAEGRSASAEVCWTLSVLAGDAGQADVAEEWWRKKSEPANEVALIPLVRAAKWLSSAGYPAAATRGWRVVIASHPDSRGAAMAHRYLGAAAFRDRRWEAAAQHYLRSAELEGSDGADFLDDVITGHTLRAVVRTQTGEDAAARRDLELAFCYAARQPSRRERLLRAMEAAPPAPWFLEVAGKIAGDRKNVRGTYFADAVCTTAERWLAYQRSLPALLKPKRVLTDGELRGLVSKLSDVTWIVADPYAAGCRWVGTANHFAVLDDERSWRVSWWPEFVEGMNDGRLGARCVAATREAVWVGTDQGLFRYNRRTGRWLQHVVGDRDPEEAIASVKATGGGLSVRLASPGEGRVWFWDVTTGQWRRR